MFLTPCFASLLTGLKFMDSFRPQCDFFIFFHNDTVSFLCYEKSVSKKYSCGQIRMITYLQMFTATSIPVKIPLIFMSFLGKTTVIFISCCFALLRSKPLRIHMSISLPTFPSHLHWTISGNAISNMRPGFCTFIQNSRNF